MSGGAEADDGAACKEAKMEVAAAPAVARPSTTIMSSSAADAFNEQYLRYFYGAWPAGVRCRVPRLPVDADLARQPRG